MLFKLFQLIAIIIQQAN